MTNITLKATIPTSIYCSTKNLHTAPPQHYLKFAWRSKSRRAPGTTAPRYGIRTCRRTYRRAGRRRNNRSIPISPPLRFYICMGLGRSSSSSSRVIFVFLPQSDLHRSFGTRLGIFIVIKQHQIAPLLSLLGKGTIELPKRDMIWHHFSLYRGSF